MRVVALLADIGCDIILSLVQRVVLVRLPQEITNLVLCLRTLGDVEPIHARSGRVRRGNDVNDIAVPEHVVDGDHLAVDLRADATDTDIRMNLEGEIQWRRFGRELDDVTLRCEDEYLIIKEDIHGENYN